VIKAAWISIAAAINMICQRYWSHAVGLRNRISLPGGSLASEFAPIKNRIGEIDLSNGNLCGAFAVENPQGKPRRLLGAQDKAFNKAADAPVTELRFHVDKNRTIGRFGDGQQRILLSVHHSGANRRLGRERMSFYA
jgi:hypothetical protein